MGYCCVRGRSRRYVSDLIHQYFAVADFCVGLMCQPRGSNVSSNLSLPARYVIYSHPL